MFSEAKMLILAQLGAQQGLIYSYNGPLGAPRMAPTNQTGLSYAYPVKIGQLGHFVLSGTKSGAVQDF